MFLRNFGAKRRNFFYAIFFTHFRREAPKKYITQWFLRIFRREAPPILRTFCTLFRFLNGFYALYAFLMIYFQRKAPPIFTHFFTLFRREAAGENFYALFLRTYYGFRAKREKYFTHFFTLLRICFKP